jgi:hypothetical protein
VFVCVCVCVGGGEPGPRQRSEGAMALGAIVFWSRVGQTEMHLVDFCRPPAPITLVVV